MIDPLIEDLLLPREATRYFPPGPGGKRLHVSAIYRYMSVGVRGIVLDRAREIAAAGLLLQHPRPPARLAQEVQAASEFEEEN